MSCCGPAGIYNIIADQGATLSRTITWKDPKKTVINLTGYTATMHVRANVTSNSTVLVLSTSNNRISINGTAGTVTLNVTASDMANVAEGRYVYDLELTAPVTNVVTRLVQGNFVVRPEVTR